jgi:ABC-type amino acid transport substrate-binding protein
MTRIRSCCLFFLAFFLPSLHAVPLTVGTIAYNPPFETMVSDNRSQEFFGFDISIIKELCKRMKRECQFKRVLFHEIPNLINSGEIDLAIGAIIITPERRMDFLFSLPYKESTLQYMVLKNTDIPDIKTLQGKTLGIYRGSPSEAFVLKQFNDNVRLKSFENSMDLIYALDKKQVAAIITNRPQADYWIANNQNMYQLLGPEFPIGEGYGIVAKLGRTELMNTINKTLVTMEKDGTYLNLYKSSF